MVRIEADLANASAGQAPTDVKDWRSRRCRKPTAESGERAGSTAASSAGLLAGCVPAPNLCAIRHFSVRVALLGNEGRHRRASRGKDEGTVGETSEIWISSDQYFWLERGMQ